MTFLYLGFLGLEAEAFFDYLPGVAYAAAKGPISLAETLPATDQLRQLGRPKTGLRSHQGDVSRQGDNHDSPGKSRGRLRQSRRRLRDVFSVAATSLRCLWQSPWSPAGLGDLTDKISLRNVTATDGDIAEMSPKPAGDWKSLQKIEHV